MNKKYSQHNEEIDVVDIIRILKIFWSKKIQIILITLISVLISIGYTYTNFNQNKNLLKIEISEEMNFSEILFLQELLIDEDNDNTNIPNINIEFYNKFISELMDFDELTLVSNNYVNSKNKYPEFSIVREQPNNHYILSFIWHDHQESKDIIEQTIKLTSDNLKKRTIEKLNYLLKIKKYRITLKDLEKLNYLSEQILIAKNLGLNSTNLNDFVNFTDQPPDLNSGIKGTDYLRGYDALEQQVIIIKNRKYDEFEQIEKKIYLLKEKDFKFIDYKIFLAEKYLLKNNFKVLFTSIILGLLLGVFYVFISDRIQSQTASKKTR